MPMQRRSDAGFTLIEVLVAFVLLALVVTACLNVYAGSARAEARARNADAAAAMIRERLGALETLNLRPGSAAEGQAGDMRWSVQVSPSDQGADSLQSARGLAWITVRVTDASGLTHTATTARWVGEAFREASSQ
jgi:prepilin-type N-terminal cleavage/methylation domain-containing protein